MTRLRSRNSDQEPSGLELVIQKATLDPEFRRRLISDPTTAIAIAFGMQLPPDFRLKFIEKDPDVDVMVVLPDLVQDDSDLLDSTLKDAQGGVRPVWLADVIRALQRTPWG